MNQEPQLFQRSMVPPVLIRPSWRRGLGWGALFGDVTLASVLPAWRLGLLILPVWALLLVTKRRSTENETEKSVDPRPTSTDFN